MPLLLAGLATALRGEESSVPPKEVVERWKRQIGDKLLKQAPLGLVGPVIVYGNRMVQGVSGPCSVHMPRADAGGAATDPKMVIPLDPREVRERHPSPQALVPAPECAAAAAPRPAEPR